MVRPCRVTQVDLLLAVRERVVERQQLGSHMVRTSATNRLVRHKRAVLDRARIVAKHEAGSGLPKRLETGDREVLVVHTRVANQLFLGLA